jgi:glutamine amidotransferase
MHHGQIGAFDAIRRRLEAGLPDKLYAERHGGTDSELIFLMMLDEGLDEDPSGATVRAVARIVDAASRAGVEPALKLTAAFSDGERLHAVRYSTVGAAPTLYVGSYRDAGRCIVSEPFDREAPNWRTVPPGSFVTLTRESMSIRAFEPARASLALAV